MKSGTALFIPFYSIVFWHMLPSISTRVRGIGRQIGTPPPYFDGGELRKTCFRR